VKSTAGSYPDHRKKPWKSVKRTSRKMDKIGEQETYKRGNPNDY
jgi:hypothetical protein